MLIFYYSYNSVCASIFIFISFHSFLQFNFLLNKRYGLRALLVLNLFFSVLITNDSQTSPWISVQNRIITYTLSIMLLMIITEWNEKKYRKVIINTNRNSGWRTWSEGTRSINNDIVQLWKGYIEFCLNSSLHFYFFNKSKSIRTKTFSIYRRVVN